MDYWNECITEALEDSNLSATQEQIDNIVNWVEGAHENFGLATGQEVANKNHISDEAKELKELKANIEKERIYKVSTKPCPVCHTAGSINVGRSTIPVDCDRCNGKGRIRIRQ